MVAGLPGITQYAMHHAMVESSQDRDSARDQLLSMAGRIVVGITQRRDDAIFALALKM